MSISSRIHDTVEGWQAEWKDRLRGWMASWLAFGIETFFDVLGKSAAPKLKPLIDTLEMTGKVPPELQPLLDEMKSPTGEIGAIFASSAGYAVVGGALGKLIDALFLPLAYMVNSVTRNVILSPPQLLALQWRGKIPQAKVDEYLSWLGYNDEDIGHWHELSKLLPPLADMVRFADFGSFDPKIIELWREFYDAPGWIAEPMSLLGITNEEGRDWANKYWFSHWRQPGRYELGEIYRRGLLGTPLIGQDEVGGGATEGEAEELVKNAYLTQGFSSFWQDRLLKLVREIPTRVDIRRWYDMRTIDEEELRSLYQRRGYFGKDLKNYVLWTKVYVALPDLIARWKNAWIKEADVRAELIELGVPPDRVEVIMQTKFKKVGAERTAAERDLTATDIIMGVKKGVITWSEGIELLMDLGFDEEEADFKLAVRIETEGGSPANMAEYKRLTQLWRVSQALPTKMTLEQIKAAEKKLAEEYPVKRKLTEEEMKVKVDTIRRRRRGRQITRDQEIAGLLELGLTVELATAYADNDDLRLHPEKEAK